MSICHVVTFKNGKVNARHLYIKIKNGAIYRYAVPLCIQQQEKLKTAIKNNGGKTLRKYWTPVRDREGNRCKSTNV